MVLVDAKGHATYVECTMEDDATDPDVAEWGLSIYEFDIQDTESARDNLQNGSVAKRGKDDSTESTCEKLHKRMKAK